MRAFGLALLVGGLPALARAEPATIIVQGDARPPSEVATEPFVATSRVQRERLAAPALRAADVLRSEAGVQITEAGGLGAPATASIRGATAAQTPVYVGGVRLNDQVGGAADLSTLPLWLVERVDVYRGNAPFDVDELGIGGAIAFEPRRPRHDEAAVSGSAGSFGTRGGFGYVSLKAERAALLGGISAERAQNDYAFRDNRGTLFQSGDDARRARQNADSRLRDVWLLARAQPSERVRLDLLYNDATREQGVPKLALVPSEQARAELYRRLAGLSARLGLGQHDSALTLRTTLLDGGTTLLDPARELGTLSERTVLSGRRVEQRVALEAPVTEALTLALALDANVETLARSDDALTSASKSSALRGAARAEWRPLAARRLSLIALVAAQCRQTRPGGGDCRDAEPAGRVGVGYRGRGYTLFANVNRYQRYPTLGELYGAGILVRGNAALRPELGLGGDVGARVAGGGSLLTWHADSSAFLRTTTDLVAYARSAQGYVVPINVGRARLLGLELGLGARAFEHVELGCNLSLLEPRDVTPGRRLANDVLPFMSRLVLAPRARVTTGKLRGSRLDHAELGADLVYLSNRFADAAGLVVLPEQASVGVTAAAAFLDGAFVARVRVANVTAAERFDIVGYPLPGRSAYAALELRTP